MWQTVSWLLASYFLGAIPTSYIVGRVFRGIDLREHGSRNLGATNLYRVLGSRYAIPVALFDIAKGAVPVLVFGPFGPASPIFPVLCGIAAVLGHMFSVFVRFRGGKGVATGAGVVPAIAPLAVLAALLIWLALVGLTGYVSLGSIIAAALFPVAVALFYPDRREVLIPFVALALLIIWMHRDNIRRLLNGTENQFGRRGKQAAPRP